MEGGVWRSERNIKKNAEVHRIFLKEESRAQIRKVTEILKKTAESRTEDDHVLLQQSEDIVEVVMKRARLKEQARQRHMEIEDAAADLRTKCQQLATAIRYARSVVVYTGAGISTAASIPDYRGPNGVWTMLQKGQLVRTRDLCEAEPTFTHMSLAELYRQGFVKRVVSQNCDGLHMRSGLPLSALSELHGNMYMEICKQCRPHRQYVRLCDVTERTAIRKHKTGRRCRRCRAELYDTIVHFGEKGGHHSPYNWKRAASAADTADVIVCLGSSLKVLKKYSCLWSMHKPISRRPRLFIVNLQWTPKDDLALLKINGKCDEVMRQVMNSLGLDVPSYTRNMDPIFALATPFRTSELKSTSKKLLVQPESYDGALALSSMHRSTALRCPVSADVDVDHREMNQTISHDTESADGQTAAKRIKTDDEIAADFHLSSECRTVAMSDKSSQNYVAPPFTGASAQSLLNLQSLGFVDGPWYMNDSACLTNGTVLPNSLEQLLYGCQPNSDLWWNQVDSRTWLEGLQNYLLLHSLASIQCIAPQPPTWLTNVGGCPTILVGGPMASYQPTTGSTIIHTGNPQQPGNLYQPWLAHPNGLTAVAGLGINSLSIQHPATVPAVDNVLSRININCSTWTPAAIDLVSFMHNYCLPSPITSVRSSVASAVDSSQSSGSVRVTRSMTAKLSEINTDDQADYPSTNAETVYASSSICLTPNSIHSGASETTEVWAEELEEIVESTDRDDDLSNSARSDVSSDSRTNSSISSSEVPVDSESALTIPGWFGKGLGMKRFKRRTSRQSCDK